MLGPDKDPDLDQELTKKFVVGGMVVGFLILLSTPGPVLSRNGTLP